MIRKKKILLLEDFESIRNVLIKSLQKRDCELVTCDNLEKAIDQLNGITIDLVICDSDSKENAAFRLLQKLRENTSYLFTPVILLATGNKELHLKKFGDFNIACYLPKPFDMNHFYTVLDRLVKIP